MALECIKNMNLERFRQNCDSLGMSLSDLLSMRHNAEARGAVEFIRVAEEALDRRFPGWNQTSSRGTPTKVSFGGEQRLFETAKAAYVWLIECFVEAFPSQLERVDWSSAFVAEGRKRLYFARSPEELFFSTPLLAKDKNNFHQLRNGWFVNLNLANDQKFQILCRFAAVVGSTFGQQWTWEVV